MTVEKLVADLAVLQERVRGLLGHVVCYHMTSMDLHLSSTRTILDQARSAMAEVEKTLTQLENQNADPK